jgi:hypothetical protein
VKIGDMNTKTKLRQCVAWCFYFSDKWGKWQKYIFWQSTHSSHMSISSVRCTAQNGQTEIQKHKEFNVPSLHVRTNQLASLTFKCTYEKKFYTLKTVHSSTTLMKCYDSRQLRAMTNMSGHCTITSLTFIFVKICVHSFENTVYRFQFYSHWRNSHYVEY